MDQVGSFFYAVRKLFWIIPIGLIVLGIITYKKTAPAKIASIPVNTPIPSGIIGSHDTATQMIATSSAHLSTMHLDLTGPWNCTFSIPEATVSAHISNNRINADLTYQKVISHFLVKGDCAYQWTGNQKEGKETCGVGQYVSMAQVAARAGLLNTAMIVDYLPQILGHSVPAIDPKTLQQSCLNTPVPESLFIIPTQIQFVKQ